MGGLTKELYAEAAKAHAKQVADFEALLSEAEALATEFNSTKCEVLELRANWMSAEAELAEHERLLRDAEEKRKTYLKANERLTSISERGQSQMFRMMQAHANITKVHLELKASRKILKKSMKKDMKDSLKLV